MAADREFVLTQRTIANSKQATLSKRDLETKMAAIHQLMVDKWQQILAGAPSAEGRLAVQVAPLLSITVHFAQVCA